MYNAFGEANRVIGLFIANFLQLGATFFPWSHFFPLGATFFPGEKSGSREMEHSRHLSARVRVSGLSVLKRTHRLKNNRCELIE